MSRTRTIFAVASIAALTLVAACGDDSSSDGDAGGDVSTEEYCALIQEYKDKADSFDDVFSSDTPDPAATEEAFTTMGDMLTDLAAKAPAEIKADVDTVSGATQDLIALFAEFEWDVTQLAAAPEKAAELTTLMENEEVTAASERLDTFGVEQCGFPAES